MKAFIEEWKLLMSGKSVIVFIVMPLIMAAVFGYAFKNSQINEAPLAVVDLDHSKYSRELIGKLDASQYISVEGVYDNVIEPDMLFYNQHYVAALYLPAGLEQNRNRGASTNIGFFVDNTIPAAVGSIRNGVNEVIAAENAMVYTGSLKAMGLSDGAIAGLGTNMNLQQRLLYNPTSSMMMSTVLGFVSVILIMLLGSATLSIVPRLREAGRLGEVLANPLELLLRILPYSLLGCVSLFLSFGVLKQVGGLRFEANLFEMAIPFFIYTLLLSFFAMIIGWTAASPDKAGGRTIILILPAFLLSGAMLPIKMLPEPLQFVTDFLPLTWLLLFLRGIGFRGGDLSYFIPQLGGAILLLAGMMAVVYLLVLKDRRAEHKLSRSEVQAPPQTLGTGM
ncbi:ABC transporter permease [Paenibacillus sp. FSL R5-0527]|uniref:ABC transporter permease n=1 Tax=Paenibacillus TaxID=44249 RepID=UPI00097B2348|nr:ABC transporter permease [Paenibacillus macerans]MED4955858.1 ABC transporter permease [Paenibacillus macerans]OMG51265.1 multidrug ABC transporter permease [Paenibacillus macerans]